MNNIVDLKKERRITTLINGIAERCANNPALAIRTHALLRGELPAMTRPAPLSIRLPEPLIERLDVLTVKLNKDPKRNLERVFKRTDTLREALIRGIRELETDLGENHRDKPIASPISGDVNKSNA